jgi:hypothetical protein
LLRVRGLKNAFTTGTPAQGAERELFAAFRTSQFHRGRFHQELAFIAGRKYSTSWKIPTTFVLKTSPETC